MAPITWRAIRHAPLCLHGLACVAICTDTYAYFVAFTRNIGELR
jgi:hypothetical protein